MGGDFGPRVVVPALVKSLRKHPGVSALVIGEQRALDIALSNKSVREVRARIDTQYSDTVIADDDSPASAIRSKQNSSMGLALQAVANGAADACISAGHTGALMALGLVILKTLPGISRPAICTTFPTSQGRCYILDLGANLDCSPAQLTQFAVLGSLTTQELDGIATPRVRLLNVGAEANKGNGTIKKTAELLEAEPLVNYCGYVEGDGLFQGDAEVVVCDGFSGNVALKATEGVARMVGGMVDDLFRSSWLNRLAEILLGGSMTTLKARLNPAHYNGAYLLGLNGVTVKSHGGADANAFGCALDVAIEGAKHNLPQVLSPILESKMPINHTANTH
jgi:glycerol-3-phosphate acyltransferase PlsX